MALTQEQRAACRAIDTANAALRDAIDDLDRACIAFDMAMGGRIASARNTAAIGALRLLAHFTDGGKTKTNEVIYFGQAVCAMWRGFGKPSV